jgi:hypothetical protein
MMVENSLFKDFLRNEAILLDKILKWGKGKGL